MEATDNLIRAFACHIEACRAENASPKTIKMYDGRHKQFLTFLQQQGHQPPFALDLLSAANVRRSAIWLRERSRGPRGGESAARMLVTVLKTTSAWLADEEYIDLDLVARVRRPRATTPARTPLAQSEVRALVDSALLADSADRDIAMIHVLLDTGMRVDGLCSMALADLNLKERRLVLRLKGHREQTLYVGSPERRDGGRTIRALRRYLVVRDEIAHRSPVRHQGRLWLGREGWPIQPGGVRAVLHRLATQAGVHDVYPHRFRHTFATWYLVRHQGDETGLRGILGHLSHEMYQTYAHLAHEIVAARAGRVALSEAWLGEESA